MMRFYALVAVLSVCPFLGNSAYAQFVPPDLNPGELYHLVFVTEETADVDLGKAVFNLEFPTLADYDAFVQAEAATNPTLTGTNQGVTYRAIVTAWEYGPTDFDDGSLAPGGPETTARDHINVVAPVYLLDGTRVAAGDDDLWDGTIESPINVQPDGRGGIVANVWTGTDALSGAAGMCDLPGGGPRAGLTRCAFGIGIHGDPVGGRTTRSDFAWVDQVFGVPSTARRYYAMSTPLTVPIPEPTSSMLLLAGMAVSTLGRRKRQAG